MPALNPAGSRGIGWTPPHRRALVGLLVLLLVVLGVRYATNRQYIADPQPRHGARFNELASRLDPNTADWQALATIPTLGEKRAKLIVAYRDQARSARPAELPFHAPADLMRIRGIGPSTVENLRPYLVFPGDGTGTPTDAAPTILRQP